LQPINPTDLLAPVAREELTPVARHSAERVGTSDIDAQYMIAISELLHSAALAGLEIEVMTRAGHRVTGVPARIGATDAGRDWPRVVRIDATILRLDQVVRCAIHAREADVGGRDAPGSLTSDGTGTMTR
jgi:hypothetical protein